MEKTNQDRVVRAAHGTMRSLGSIVGVSCNLARDTGRLIGSSSKIMTERSSKMLDRFSKTVKQSGKKIAGLKLRRAVAVRDSLGRAVEESALVKDSQTEAVSETSALEPDAEEAMVRPRAMRALVTALESDLAAIRRELAETQSQAQKTQSQFTSQLKALRAEKESLVSELAKARNETNEVKPREDALNEPATVPKSKLDASRHKLEKAEKDAKAKSSSGVSAAQTQIETALSNGDQKKAAVVPVEEKAVSSMEAAEKIDVRIEGSQIQPLVAEAEAPKPVDVTLEEVEATDLPNASEKVIFTKALSDITSEDAAVRTGAVKVIAGIRHELSVRTLAAQIAHEPSVQVQQECIKGLMTLQMTEGLPAVERALTDRAAPVRLAAVWGLYRLAGAESAPALIRMFSDEDEDVRRRAVTCIGWLGQEELAVELLPLLSDSSVSVRRAAVEAMGNLRCRQVVSALIEHLNDPAESVRKAVLSALKIITGKKMSGPFPKNKKSLERLIARWQEWWKEQQPG